MIDEKAARRPTWVDGTPVVMADNQEWTLPRPVVVFVPAETDLGFEIRARLGDDGTFGTFSKALETAEGGNAFVKAALAAGKYLLLLNYDLTADQVADLLQFNFSDESSDGYRVMEGVLAVVRGQGESLPKP